MIGKCTSVKHSINICSLFLSIFHRPSLELPSIAVTYRQPLERYSPVSPNQSTLKDKDHPLHTLNRTFRTLLNPRRRPHSPGNGNGTRRHLGHDREHNQKKSFMSYVRSREGGEEEETSSGSSSLSDSQLIVMDS